MNQLVHVQQTWEQQAEEVAQIERPTGGAFFSTRAGQLTLGDEAMPGNQVAVIVLDFLRMNTYYPDKWDDGAPVPPTCYAFDRREEDMAPHPTMQADLSWFKPQAMECSACPLNEWGSSPNGGRGKACQNRRQLAMIPAGYYTSRRGSRDFDLHLFEDPRHFAAADVAFLRLPVTSTNGWAKYVNAVSASYRRPPAGVITRVFTEPDPKTQYKVSFEVIEPVSDEIAAAVMQRQMQQMSAPVHGFQPPRDEAPRQQTRHSLRGGRR